MADAGTSQMVERNKLVTLDGSKSYDPEGTPVQYIWSLVSKPSSSTVNLTSSNVAKPTFTPDAAGDYVFKLVVNDGLANSLNAATVTVTACTPFSGRVSANMTIGTDLSPYCIPTSLVVERDVTLTVQPGVTLYNGDLMVIGNLAANGTTQQPITFNNVNIVPGGEINHFHHIEISNAVYAGGSILAPNGRNAYGTLSLMNSSVSNLQSHIYLWYPEGNTVIRSNVFKNSGGISYGISLGTTGSIYTVPTLRIENNHFAGWTTDYAIENWEQSENQTTFITGNTFATTTSVALRLQPSRLRASMNAPGNYFGTTDLAVIQSMIYDKSDDPNIVSDIVYQPYLNARYGGTPTGN